MSGAMGWAMINVDRLTSFFFQAEGGIRDRHESEGCRRSEAPLHGIHDAPRRKLYDSCVWWSRRIRTARGTGGSRDVACLQDTDEPSFPQWSDLGRGDQQSWQEGRPT